MQHIRAKFNDKTDPSYQFENQCVAFKRVCPKCGTRFKPTDTVCGNCGQGRPRCQHKAMSGEVVCRSHATGRPYSIYSKLAGTLSDAVLEEFIESPGFRDLEQEFALAKLALGQAFNSEISTDSQKILNMVKDFFYIAEKKKNIEKGQVLNISWDDKLVNTMRSRLKLLIKTFNDILNEKVEDENLRKEILLALRDRTKMVGNMLTAPYNPEDYKDTASNNL